MCLLVMLSFLIRLEGPMVGPIRVYKSLKENIKKLYCFLHCGYFNNTFTCRLDFFVMTRISFRTITPRDTYCQIIFHANIAKNFVMVKFNLEFERTHF